MAPQNGPPAKRCQGARHAASWLDFARGAGESRRGVRRRSSTGEGSEDAAGARGGIHGGARTGGRPGRARCGAPGLPLGVDGGGVRLGRRRPARLAGRRDVSHPPRDRDPPDGRADAGDDRDDGDDARRAVGWARAPGPRRLRAPGRRGLARAAVREAAWPDAGIRRHRARDPRPPAAARARWRALPDPVSRTRRHRAGEAAPEHRARPGGPAHLPGGDRTEERGPRGGDRGRLATRLLLARPRPRLPRRAGPGLRPGGRRRGSASVSTSPRWRRWSSARTWRPAARA